ncbi:hypothetical protein [Methylocapsa aurea]|uniref:hypothetical protein n=1 Tax=Methylocapsa aurea TaxID=663610 RepID=UPI0006925FE3|nr:hypothetical protein [Methylocapsa aurea]
MAVLNLPAIKAALRRLQRLFPQINKELFDRRDPLDDEVLSNMLEGYAMVDRLIREDVDIFAMGQLHYWLELNAIVLCGVGDAVRLDHRRLIEATENRFYGQPDGGIRDIMDWYARNRGESVWRRAAGVYIRVLSEPQLFIEGNHRAGALIMSYVLAREGRAPFVLTDKNAREYFNPSSVFKKSNKRSIMMRLKMPGLTRALADYLKRQANKAFLDSTESAQAGTGDNPRSSTVVGHDEP